MGASSTNRQTPSPHLTLRTTFVASLIHRLTTKVTHPLLRHPALFATGWTKTLQRSASQLLHMSLCERIPERLHGP